MIDTLAIQELETKLLGEVYTDKATKIRYATDASVYYKQPGAIAIPKTESDIKEIIAFANSQGLSITPRAAGTSLAGQVVGEGLIVDVSKHFNKIDEPNISEKWVKVQPGVILDELNRKLAPHNLFFGPEASTANRCMIGGMVGNNACGLHAVIYGTTREHILEVSGYLSDGSKVVFKDLSTAEFENKCKLDTLEGKIYRNIKETLNSIELVEDIKQNYPEPRLIRRNNGYALDQLLEMVPFSNEGTPFNLSKLICGSEGTLLFITELKLNLVDAPPKNKALVCAHFNTINQALKANIIALKHGVTAVELMDDIILEASKNNLDQQKNRFFVKGDPKALLLIEFAEEKKEEIQKKSEAMIQEMQAAELGYHYPILQGPDTKKAWTLRKAGLGIMANIPGDTKSVTVIEDTAVHPDVLPEYIEEFTKIMEGYGEECVYHAHAGTGEIHLRPRLNLKEEADIAKFEKLAWDIAKLVKKYKGSLSGEHGDGRLRGGFVPYMLGDKVYNALKELKNTWDPNNLFNPGIIIDSPEITADLRYQQSSKREIKTHFDFSEKLGIVRAAESCNGSGDCRKLHTAGGTMCPSYMVTRDEKHVTRGRANILRDFLINSPKKNPFDHKEIYEALDLCLSCKACKSECPSSVDVAKLKAEFLQHYYDANGIPLRTRAIANIGLINQLGSIWPQLFNLFLSKPAFSTIIKKSMGIAPKRSMPTLSKTTLEQWSTRNNTTNGQSKGQVILFIDEFTNFNDAEIGIKAIRLLNKLGYGVEVVKHAQSGRAYLSKGMLRKAKKLAIQNVNTFKPLVSKNKPLIGLEPSAILSFRDEYPDLVGDELKSEAIALAKNCLLIEEFIANEFGKGNIDDKLFTEKENSIKLHGHCQQKAIASTKSTIKALSIPKNYSVSEIASGCCGMAGSFGYEKEHYDTSMKVGELVLFPEVRKTDNNTEIAAPGTSCRHQIYDGTTRKALHPAEILFEALK